MRQATEMVRGRAATVEASGREEVNRRQRGSTRVVRRGSGSPREAQQTSRLGCRRTRSRLLKPCRGWRWHSHRQCSCSLSKVSGSGGRRCSVGAVRRRSQSFSPMQRLNRPCSGSEKGRIARAYSCSEQSQSLHPVLFLDSVSRQASKEEIGKLLRQYGKISNLVLSRKPRRNNPLLFVLADFDSFGQVDAAVRAVHGRTFLGNKLFARRAKYGQGRCIVSKDALGDVVSEEVKQSAYALAETRVGDGVGDQEDLTKGARLRMSVKHSPEGELGVDASSGVVRIGGIELIVAAGCPDVEVEIVDDSDNLRPVVRIRIGFGGTAPGLERACKRGNVAVEEGRSNTKAEVARASSAETAAGRAKKESWNAGMTPAVWPVGYYLYPYWYNPVGLPIVDYSGAGQPAVGFGQYGGTNGGQGYGWGEEWSRQAASTLSPSRPILPGVHTQFETEKPDANRCLISICEPSASKEVACDPVVEELIKNARASVEEQGSDEFWPDRCFTEGQNQPGSVFGQAQLCVVEGEEDGEDFRRLFDEPEFPPGSEPEGCATGAEQASEEVDVKEEAKQTLQLAKKLGCSIPNEERTLRNLEGIIRESCKATVQVHQGAKSSPGDSEASSMVKGMTSKSNKEKKMKKVALGFSKMSRVSKLACKGKSRSRANTVG